MVFPFYDAGGSESWYPSPSQHTQKIPPGGVYFTHLQKILKNFFALLGTSRGFVVLIRLEGVNVQLLYLLGVTKICIVFKNNIFILYDISFVFKDNSFIFVR